MLHPYHGMAPIASASSRQNSYSRHQKGHLTQELSYETSNPTPSCCTLQQAFCSRSNPGQRAVNLFGVSPVFPRPSVTGLNYRLLTYFPQQTRCARGPRFDALTDRPPKQNLVCIQSRPPSVTGLNQICQETCQAKEKRALSRVRGKLFHTKT